MSLGVVIARPVADLQARTLPLRANRIAGGGVCSVVSACRCCGACFHRVCRLAANKSAAAASKKRKVDAATRAAEQTDGAADVSDTP